MSNQRDTGTLVFEANEAITQFARLKLLATGKVATAGASDNDIGVAMRDAKAGDHIAVRCRNAEGSVQVIASKAITAGDAIYAQSLGRVTDSTLAGGRIGVALEDASAAGDVIEAVRA